MHTKLGSDSAAATSSLRRNATWRKLETETIVFNFLVSMHSVPNCACFLSLFFQRAATLCLEVYCFFILRVREIGILLLEFLVCFLKHHHSPFASLLLGRSADVYFN